MIKFLFDYSLIILHHLIFGFDYSSFSPYRPFFAAPYRLVGFEWYLSYCFYPLKI